MGRILKLILVILIVPFISTSAIAGITIKINSSTVTDSDLILNGINYYQLYHLKWSTHLCKILVILNI